MYPSRASGPRRAEQHGLRRLPPDWRPVGSSADVHYVRPRRTLRQLTEPSRDRPLPLDGAPLIPSYEPSEDWWYCYIDDVAFVVDGAPSFERAGQVATAATHVGPTPSELHCRSRWCGAARGSRMTSLVMFLLLSCLRDVSRSVTRGPVRRRHQIPPIAVWGQTPVTVRVRSVWARLGGVRAVRARAPRPPLQG